MNDSTMAAAQPAAAAARAEGHGLYEALEWYVAHGRAAREAPAIEACVCAYLEEKRAAARRSATLKGYRVSLTRFAERFSGRPPIAITTLEIRHFLRQWQHPNTIYSWWRRLFSFFNWALARGWVFENPLPRAMARPLRRYRPGRYYTPEEAARILREVKGTDELGVWLPACRGR